MNAARPAINVIEKNPYLPRPFVFSEMAVCLRDAIRAAGYPSEHLGNRIDPAAYSIVLGGTPEFERELEHMDSRRCAIFNFEQMGSTSHLVGPEYRAWLADWLVLDYHASNIAFLKRENGPRQRAFELPIVPSASLVTTGDEPKAVDVLFFGTMSPRRERVLRQLEAMDLKVEAVAGAYGPELAPAIRRAKIVLHVHFYETGLFPVARIVQPVMMGLPIVCETSVFSALNDWSHSGIVFAGYEHLAEACRELLESPGRMAARARLSREFVDHIDFATPFARVVQAFESLAAPAPPSPPAPTPEPGALTDAEIEAILIAEGAQPPEAGRPAPQPTLVHHEYGQGRTATWIAWIMIILFAVAAIRAYL